MQSSLYPGPLPKIRTTPRKGGYASLDPYKQTTVTTTVTLKWEPGERDRYRPICPPGYVDHCPIESSPAEQAFRHSGWTADRARVLAAMAECNVPEKRLARIRSCGGGAWVMQCPTTGECVVDANYCGDRMCQPCARGRSMGVATQLAKAMQGKEVRHVVLTLRHRAMPLSDQITRIYRCFSNLRRNNGWARYCTGGAAFLEIKLGAAGDWHVHLHCVVEGRFMPHGVLSGLWLAATGDSDICWIGAIPERSGVRGYVAKYATKAYDRSVLANESMLQEAILALRGRRACLTFGAWRGIELHPPKIDRAGWKALGRLDAIIMRANAGCAWAAAVVKKIKKGLKSDESDKPGTQPVGTASSGSG